MAGYRGTHPRYAAMAEQWEKDNEDWKEFPMMVYPGAPDPRQPVYAEPGDPGYKPGKLRYEGVVVQNEEELARVIDGAGSSGVHRELGQPARASTLEDDRDALLQEAANLGLKEVDPAWSLARIQDAIDTKKAEKKQKPTAEVV